MSNWIRAMDFGGCPKVRFARVMQKLRALLLSGTLLTNPVGLVAAAVFSASPRCCCGAKMCPVHCNQASNKKKMLCSGPAESQPKCTCGVRQESQPIVQQVLPKATLNCWAILTAPAVEHAMPVRAFVSLLFGTIAPPKQAPRP